MLSKDVKMTILDKIVENKRIEVEKAKVENPVSSLQQSIYFERLGNSLVEQLKSPTATGIIAEFKRKSPSKGDINTDAEVEETTFGYAGAGASGISVLTDHVFFGGSKEDLIAAREKNPGIPLLRKDFIIDEYQIYEAKAWGADLILLIAAWLSPEEINQFGKKAHELGLEVLLEVHDEEELEKSPLEFADIIGVNNRNLKNFAENNVDASLRLSSLIPLGKVKISESCISSPETVKILKDSGYKGFLMGENFMKTADPAQALKDFVSQLN